MSNTEKPDVATVDGNDVDSRLAFADKAESLLRRVLVALGYDNADKLTPMDLLTGITAWVSMLHYAKLDAFGRYAQTWWEAFKMFCPVFGPGDSVQHATDAMNAFARMFPPTLSANEESERDTINDIAALSEELDKQTVIVAGLQSENAALLRANEHHASELASIRIKRQCDNDWLNNELTKVRVELAQAESLVCKLSETFTTEKARTKDALVPLAKPERVEPGQRWACVGSVTSIDDDTIMLSNHDCTHTPMVLYGNDWIYLGTDKA